MKRLRCRRKLFDFGMALLLTVLLTACASVAPASTPADGAASSTFFTLAQGDTAIAEIKSPALFLATNAAAAARFAGWINGSESAASLARVDFATHLVVAVLAGVRPSSGYSVTVERVADSDEGVIVTVAFSDPPVDQVAADVISFPYHVVTVPHTAVTSRSGTVWRMVSTTGEVLAKVTAP